MRIGVVGHRSVSNPPAAVEAAAASLRRLVGDPAEDAAFELLSCLAEGADRLVVEAAKRWRRMRLVAVLPLPEQDYARDFNTKGSLDDFAAALRRANEVVQLTAAGARADAYRQAGRYVVDRCDHLMALWDGHSTGAAGGTADILTYARTRLDAARIHIVPVDRAPVEASR